MFDSCAPARVQYSIGDLMRVLYILKTFASFKIKFQTNQSIISFDLDTIYKIGLSDLNASPILTSYSSLTFLISSLHNSYSTLIFLNPISNNVHISILNLNSQNLPNMTIDYLDSSLFFLDNVLISNLTSSANTFISILNHYTRYGWLGFMVYQ